MVSKSVKALIDDCVVLIDQSPIAPQFYLAMQPAFFIRAAVSKSSASTATAFAASNSEIFSATAMGKLDVDEEASSEFCRWLQTLCALLWRLLLAIIGGFF